MESKMKYKIVKSLSQYTEYCDRHEELMLKDEEKHSDEIELLELLIEDYDQRVMKEKNATLNPVELLRTLLRDSNITQSELSKSINVSRQLISDVLGYRRNISKEMMIKLSKYFSMDQEAFSREYDLKSNREKLKKSQRAAGGSR
ncbi:MAG: helix-turn-helix domain-containing protein [Lewinellaceae bacterium]|nr:helix-turn-helix domain-containing protein [Lewinellaceae bacterium]